jgi:phage tail protein X
MGDVDMRPAELAEIEDNELAQATMSFVDRIRPHLTTIVAAVGVAFAGMAAWTLISSQKAAEKAQGWDECLTAVATRDAGRLSEVATRFPGSSAAVWSQILLADNALAEGGRILLIDKKLGRERLQAAADAYAAVLAQRPASMAAERATFGLARAREALGELEAARRGYQALAADFPSSPLRSLAESHAASLARPATIAWYDWFDKDAKPAAPATPADAPAATGAAAPAG